jgi:predicted permease
MNSLLQDLRYGLRILLKTPGFAAVAVLTLAIGIGANTTIFSMVNVVLLRQLPYKDPDHLMCVWSIRTDQEKTPFSIPDFMDYQEQNQTLERIAGFASWGANLTGTGTPERLQGLRVSGNLFQLLGVEAVAGRTLLPEDDKADSPRAVVLSYGLWKSRFGGDLSLIENTITLNGDSYTVVGVLPPSFFFPNAEAEIAVPLKADSDPWRNDRNSISFVRAISRLKPGVLRPHAESDMTALAQRLQQLYPNYNANKQAVRIVPMKEEILGNFRMSLLLLLVAVSLVLLIACANLANLTLAKASARKKEVAIRMALGCSRKRLIRQMLTECILLALLGGALGVFLAEISVQALISLSPANLPRANEATIDDRVLAFTLGVSLLSGLIFGLAPALHDSKMNVSHELKAGNRNDTSGGGRSRTRSLLVIGEVAISLVLLIGAGLLVKSFMQLQNVNLGFSPDNLLVVRLALPKARYAKVEAITAFYDKVSPQLELLPGVQSASLISNLPLSGSNTRIPFTIVGKPPISLANRPATQYRMIGLDYFRTMNIPLQEGRDFTSQDRSNTRPAVLINETFARRFWQRDSPIGEHLLIDDNNQTPRDVEIVGVVGDVKHFGLDAEPVPELYLPVYQIPSDNVGLLINNMNWVIRTAGDPLTLATAVRREVQSVDGDVPASSIKSMTQYLSASVAPRRFNMLLLMIFAIVALLLAAMGLYAVISYSVSQQTREIGIRMALGAQRRDVLRLVVGYAFKITALGIGIGLLGAFAFTRIISSLLYGISATDISTFLFIPLLFACIALLASYLPARRATKVDPLIALRFE